ncbi:BTB/POZ domain-containing protein [Orchesella cincta]|uniref:BTB/POZ domain-containing protein n=1 Tax=Orchesella cincta TaxID=48709 RepID=A0A1D2M716_ORCCI|nr:BTB/POZ domain-containing protein [Orchesella cincta]
MEMNITKPVENFDGAVAIVDFLKAQTTPINYYIHTTIFLEWSDLKMNTIREPCAVLDLLFSEKLLADCCIVTSNKTEVSCHRCILAANSNVIRTMLTNGMQETQTNRIEMTDVSEEVVNLLVAYLYGRVMDTEEMKEEIAFDLLCTAHKYNIKPLEELMVVTLFNRPNDSFSMNTVLDVYFFTKNIEDFNVLSEKMLKILKGSPNQLLASSAFQDIMEKTPNEATKLALKLLQLVIGEPNTRALPAIEI